MALIATMIVLLFAQARATAHASGEGRGEAA
jgi:spermidine/putrescine transport system permease protein